MACSSEGRVTAASKLAGKIARVSHRSDDDHLGPTMPGSHMTSRYMAGSFDGRGDAHAFAHTDPHAYVAVTVVVAIVQRPRRLQRRRRECRRRARMWLAGQR